MIHHFEEGSVLHGILEPQDLGKVAEASAQKRLLGASGLILPHEIIVRYPANVREKMGGILQLIPRVFVLDRLSREWLPHLAMHGEVGPDVGWLVDAKVVVEHLRDNGIALVQNLTEAYQVARRGEKFLLLIEPSSQGGMDTSYFPLYRWAVEYGVTDHVVRSVEEAGARKDGAFFGAGRIRALQEDARGVLSTKKTVGVLNDLDALLGGTEPQYEHDMLRTFRLGDEMDPATHYDDHYYGVDEKGIYYPRPDGSWAVYRGTAHRWGGNDFVAQAFAKLCDTRGNKLLDVGAGSGDFVRAALEAGFDPYGVDISSSAFSKAEPDVRDRLYVSDVTKDEKAPQWSGQFDIVTALDVWEHMYLEDVKPLIAGIRDSLVDGGLHFACICTRGASEKDHTYSRDTKISRENAWVLVAGHVTIRSWWWWARLFKSMGFKLRHDLMELFQVIREDDPGFRTCESWSARNVLIVQKV